MSKLSVQLARQAIVMEIGGFRPPIEPEIALATSWFGRVNLAMPGEDWPHNEGEPMHALCQINLTELPFRPPHLDDLSMIMVFIGPRELPVNEPNGDNWCLRAYTDLQGLVKLEPVKTGSGIKALAMRPKSIKQDFPCLDDISQMGVDVDDDFNERHVNTEGLKLGGWPTLVQSVIYWQSPDCDQAEPAFAFQIDSSEKGHWQWGDNGVAYFARGTRDPYKNEWFIEWQCY